MPTEKTIYDATIDVGREPLASAMLGVTKLSTVEKIEEIFSAPVDVVPGITSEEAATGEVWTQLVKGKAVPVSEASVASALEAVHVVAEVEACASAISDYKGLSAVSLDAPSGEEPAEEEGIASLPAGMAERVVVTPTGPVGEKAPKATRDTPTSSAVEYKISPDVDGVGGEVGMATAGAVPGAITGNPGKLYLGCTEASMVPVSDALDTDKPVFVAVDSEAKLLANVNVEKATSNSPAPLNDEASTTYLDEHSSTIVAKKTPANEIFKTVVTESTIFFFHPPREDTEVASEVPVEHFIACTAVETVQESTPISAVDTATPSKAEEIEKPMPETIDFIPGTALEEAITDQPISASVEDKIATVVKELAVAIPAAISSFAGKTIPGSSIATTAPTKGERPAASLEVLASEELADGEEAALVLKQAVGSTVAATNYSIAYAVDGATAIPEATLMRHFSKKEDAPVPYAIETFDKEVIFNDNEDALLVVTKEPVSHQTDNVTVDEEAGVAEKALGKTATADASTPLEVEVASVAVEDPSSVVIADDISDSEMSGPAVEKKDDAAGIIDQPCAQKVVEVSYTSTQTPLVSVEIA